MRDRVGAATAPDEAEWQAEDDRQILAEIAAGDDRRFGLLVERHQRRLLRLADRMLGDREAARDAVQEVFLKAYRKAGSYSPRGKVYTWLYRIAVNHCLNRLRRRKVVRFLSLEKPPEDDGAAFDPPDGATEPDEAAAARQRWRAARRAIAALPSGQRAVLVLARFEGLSYKEIATTLGITVGAVESRLFRAMRNLEAELEG